MTDARPAAPRTDRRTSRLARTMTYGLCGALLVLGVAQVEVWPQSAFRLFSGVRGPETTAWLVVAVDADGDEHTLDLSGMPESVGLPHHLLPRLVDASEAERAEVLATYVDAAGGPAAVSARVYRVVYRASTEAGVPSTELSRSVAYEVEVT